MPITDTMAEDEAAVAATMASAQGMPVGCKYYQNDLALHGKCKRNCNTKPERYFLRQWSHGLAVLWRLNRSPAQAPELQVLHLCILQVVF